MLRSCIVVLLCSDLYAVASGTLPTAGGDAITVTGSHLGSNSSVVSLECTGGLWGYPVHSFVSRSCSVESPGVRVMCASPAGVGGNYSFRLVVDGGASGWSVSRFSYSSPTISELAANGSTLVATTVSSCLFVQ